MGARGVLWAILVANAAVAAAKIGYGMLSGSLAIYADGMHSVSDGFGNVVGLVVVAWALKPPDDDHPYGHGKLEVVAGGALGAWMILLAGQVLYTANQRLQGEAPEVEIGPEGLAIVAATWVINMGVAWWESKKGRELGSPFLLADARHTASDVAVTAGVLVSAVLTWTGLQGADLWAGILVAVFIGWAGAKTLYENLGFLTDRVAVDPSQVDRVARSVDGVVEVHKIRSRGWPGAAQVDLHVQVDGGRTVAEGHSISHEVMSTVMTQVGGVVEVQVHLEPAVATKPQT